MNVRPKTIRRLLILFVAFVVVAGGIAAWLEISLQRAQAQIAQLRVQAKAAFDAKDYPKAVGLFSQFLSRGHSQDTDPEAVFEYGVSRANTPMEGGRNVYEAIGVFEHYLLLEPQDPHDARHELLKLYTQAHYNKEARTLADKLLAKDPDDPVALRSLVQCQSNDHNYADALAACHTLNQLKPDDLATQRQELALMDKTQAPADKIVAHARDLFAAHPHDARFAALLSVAQGQYAGDAAAARRSIEAAAKLAPPDDDSVLQIINLLDQQLEFPLADDLLARALSRDPHAPRLLLIVAERSWERQRPAEVLARLTNIGPQSSTAEPALLGYKAMALYELARPSEATPLVNALAARSDDAARAWTVCLRTRYAAHPPKLAQVLKNYRQAVDLDPANPAFHLMLGQARATEGATDLAVRQWVQAGTMGPSWALPYCLISRTLCDAARYPDAVRAASIARQRAPGSQAAETAYALAWFGLDTQSAAASQEKSLLSLVEQIQKAWALEPRTLPVYVSLLCRQNQRTKAAAVVRKALGAQPPCSTATLVRLAAACGQEHLDLAAQVLDRAEQLHGPDPGIAFARAIMLVREGKRAQALASMESACRLHPKELSWQLAAAQFAGQIGAPGAAEKWAALGNAHPEDLRVQRAILASPARLSDRALWRRTITRTQALTDPDDPLCRIEDARWRLAGHPSAKDLPAIVAALQQVVHDSPGLADAHSLLAGALLRTGGPENLAQASTELGDAHGLNPADIQTAAELARVLDQQGMRAKAVALIDQIAARPHLSQGDRLLVAKLYRALDRDDAAVHVLTSGDAAAGDDPHRDALLANLYRGTGRAGDAALLYKKLLASPRAGPDALAAAAEFFDLSDQPGLSGQCLDRLAKMPLKPGTLDILRAHLLELRGANPQALAVLLAGTKEHPTAAQVWQELSGFYLRHGRLDDARAAAAQGLQAAPASPALSAMLTQIGRLRTLGRGQAGPLTEVISHDPLQSIASQAIQLLADAKAQKQPGEMVLASLAQLAAQHPDFLPLQELLIERYAMGNRLKDAIEVASRAAQTAPRDAGVQRLLCAVEERAGDWDGAREAAQRWRQASASGPLQPDLALAATWLQQPTPDPQAAIKQLAPYMAAGAARAARDAALPIYCRALIAAGRTGDAAGLLKPLLANSAHWRAAWIELAGTAPKDASAASAWLKNVIPFIPADSIPEHLALAGAWEQIGSRYGSAPAHQAAHALLEPIISRPDAPAAAWGAWAGVNESLGNLPQAVQAWRHYLKQVPNEPHALNNLAYLLLHEKSPEKLAEAQRLAAAAIAADPDVATFYDTLARIQLEQGRTADAIKSFHDALDRGPASVEAMIGLADVLDTRPADRDEARALLQRIDAALQAGKPLDPALRKELDRVKNALSASL